MTGKQLVSISVVSLLFLSIVEVQPTYASMNVSVDRTMTIGAGTWSTQLAAPTTAPSSAAYQIVWTGNVNKQYALFSIVNMGTYDLLSAHFTYSSAKGNGDTTNPPALTFELCSGTWDATTYACSGAISAVGTGTGGAISFSSLIPLGNRITLRATNSRSSTSNYITTFNAQAFRSDIRSGVRVNS